MRKCIHKETGKDYAVKIVRTRDEEMLFLLKNEFRNISQIYHNNIIKVHEMYIDKKHAMVYTIMECFEGKELFKHISNIGHYSENKAKFLFKQLLQGIRHLHNTGVVHRDLKPNNILVSNGRVFFIY